MDDRAKAAFAAATDAVKQLLTLATGTVGATIALFDDAKTPGVVFTDRLLVPALACVAVSVVSGLFALGALTGQLGARTLAEPSVYAGPIRLFHTLQMAAFGLGLVLIVVVATR